MRHPFIVLVVIMVPIAAIIVALFLTINNPITITDSGSTNSQGFVFTINPSGGGVMTLSSGAGTYFDSFTFDYKSIADAVREPHTFMELFITRPSCAHSASFGSVRTIGFDLMTSGDISCIADPDLQNSVSAALDTAYSSTTGSTF